MGSNTGYIPKSRVGPLEAYFTPPEVAEAAMRMLSRKFPVFEPRNCLEPGCGEGVHCDSALIQFPMIEQSIAVDITDRNVAHTFYRSDFLSWETGEAFDLIVTNPPFSLAERFVRKSVSLLTPGGLGLYLCRYSFIATIKRQSLWSTVNLREVWIVVPRPSFQFGGNDACEYAYFLFDRGVPSKQPKLDWLVWRDEPRNGG